MKAAVYYHPDFAEKGYFILRDRVKPGFDALQDLIKQGKIRHHLPILNQEIEELLMDTHSPEHIASVQAEGEHYIALLSAAGVVQAAEQLALRQVDFAVEAIKAVVREDQDWIPDAEGTSLYIRPFIIATDPYLGVRPSLTYKFMVILSPVGAYYPEGIDPVKIYVESQYVRTVKGGMGYVKTPGNYAASLIAQVEAKKKGYTQVLWLDGVEKKYIEEVGTMNVFFKIDGEMITPAVEGSILAGITRDSTIELLKSWGIPTSERRISIQELYDAHAQGKLEEAFGTGTAAVISPIGELNWDGNIIAINGGQIGEYAAKIYDTITGIQYGNLEDKFGWIVEV